MTLDDFSRFYYADWVAPDGTTTVPAKSTSIPRLRGGLGVDISGFFAIVYNIMKQEDPNITFVPAYPDYILKSRGHVATRDEPTATLSNTVTFKVVRKTCGTLRGRGPHGPRTEMKPMIREQVAGVTSGAIYSTYGQRFDCTIQLDCWSKTRFEVEILAEYMEELLLKYTGLIKSLGIKELFFMERLDDKMLQPFMIPSISLQYFVQVEKIWCVDTQRISEIRATFKLEV